MKLDKNSAYRLLTDGLENPLDIMYVTHCIYVGALAGMIAGELGLDSEKANVLGLIHDVGRRINSGIHAFAGYNFLMSEGYEEYAPICLTHSFLSNDIDCCAGRTMPHDAEGYEFIKAFVEKHENTPYDEIIQLCDLLCLNSGGTTLENRLADIESRKGTHSKSQFHRETAIKQKEKIEKALGHSVYDFYPVLNSIPMPG